MKEEKLGKGSCSMDGNYLHILECKHFKGYGKPTHVLWISVTLAMYILATLLGLIELSMCKRFYAVTQHLFFIALLLYYSVHYLQSSSETFYWFIVATLICVFIYLVSLYFVQNSGGSLSQFISWITALVSVPAMALACWGVIYWMWKSDDIEQYEKDVFYILFGLSGIITVPGMITLSLALIIFGPIIELIFRIFTCQLKPCSTQKKKPKLVQRNIPVVQLKFEDIEARDTSCCSCMESFENSEENIIKLSCNPLHMFHESCAERALGTKFECPLCAKATDFI